MRKLILSSLVLLLVITFLSSCKKNKFRPKQTNFTVGTIYQAESDGLLTVHYKTNSFGPDLVQIYLDQNTEPTTLNTEIGDTGPFTIAVYNNDYWKVVQGSAPGTVKIEFTPFQ